MSQPFELVTDTFNHRPEVEFQGIWYPYTGARMKDCYDLRLKDGTELRGWYPNACAWSSRNEMTKYEISRVEDSDVAEIRLMLDEEIEEICYFGFTGEERLRRNISYFGCWLPTIVRNEDGTTTLVPRVRRVFENMVRSSWDGDNQFWLYPDELSVEELKEAVYADNREVEGFYTSLTKYLKQHDVECLESLNSLTVDRLIELFDTAQKTQDERIAAVVDRFNSFPEDTRRASRVAKQKKNWHRAWVDKGTPTVLYDKPEKDGLTGKQRRKQEKKQRRLDREQAAK